jgi:apolipoprotein N-acyltransferase
MESYSYYAHNLHRHKVYTRCKYVITPLLGASSILSFSPFNIWPIAIASLCLLLFFLMTSHAKQAAWQGFLYGLGYFGAGASWVFISLYRFGGAGAPLSLLLTGLFIAALSLYYAAASFTIRHFLARNPTATALLAFPACWWLAEWCRGHWFTGFPWLMLGYTQTHGPLEAYAPVIGVYGLSLLIFLSAGCLTLFCFRRSQRTYLLCILLLASIWITAMPLETINWTHPLEQTVNTALIQGNIPQKMKWDAANAEKIIQHYKKLSQPYWRPNQLIIWPEAAVPLFPNQAYTLLQSEKKLAYQYNGALLTGIPLYNPKADAYYNAAINISRQGGYYLKRHLVPFGEFFPFKNSFKWVYQKLSIPLSDLTPGPQNQPLLQVDGIFIAPYICYEIAFPAEVANTLDNANLIVVLTDDSWFGDSLAAPQHLQMAQMRAKETGRYLLFSSNTGPSAIINPEGDILSKTPTDRAFVLTGRVPAMTGTTPYLILGDHPIGVIVTIMLVWLTLLRRNLSVLTKYQEVELNFELIKKL